MPVTAEMIRKSIVCDPILSEVVRMVEGTVPWNSTAEEFKPFLKRKDELAMHHGCIVWGKRVVVPEKLRQTVLQELHEAHPGMCRMKALVRSYIWWPKMDSDIEDRVRGCRDCQVNQNKPETAPVHPWESPKGPWIRLHVGFAGPFLGQMFLIISDAYSKWLEVQRMNSSKSGPTVART